MTLVARTVPANSRCFLQRAVILDGMIEVLPFWIDQLSDRRLPGGLDNGSRTAGPCADERASNHPGFHLDETRLKDQLPGGVDR